jgi:protein-L-isoaspartate(D-aspartate) O-methyltransferase
MVTAWLFVTLMLSVNGLTLALGTREGERSPSDRDQTRAAREAMVRQIEARGGISNPAVLAAMRHVPRHVFVPAPQRPRAYLDRPLSIGHEQTISQPYIVALMTDLAAVGPGSRVLEVGTGSGYQAAVLAELGAKVHSIEIVAELGQQAAATLRSLGYSVDTRIGDGYRGWPESAPFDAIVVTAAPPEIPAPLLQQLAPGGRLVVPVGDDAQVLKVITRGNDGTLTERSVAPVRFVPMTGEAGGKSD